MASSRQSGRYWVLGDQEGAGFDWLMELLEIRRLAPPDLRRHLIKVSMSAQHKALIASLGCLVNFLYESREATGITR
jgi:hypothetical protein